MKGQVKGIRDKGKGQEDLAFDLSQQAETTRMRTMALRACIVFAAGRSKEYSDEYYTPSHIVEPLGIFDLDPSAGPSNHALRNVRRPEDGLAIGWHGRVWLNPPYSDIEQWLAKFVDHGNGIVLVNARSDARWFQVLLGGADAVLFPRGHIRFARPDKVAGYPPVGSALVAYGKANAKALKRSGIPGLCLVHA